ncbi:hypothetical protein ACH5RR_013084 [Cinchona calisaya]|uniref:Protein CPR-5 n=1 Tax=Cinchona calisaya TaxID=153742 RepID=A0ABD2ZZ54_9GENT
MDTPPLPHSSLQVSATNQNDTVFSSDLTAQIPTGSSMTVTFNGSKLTNQITKRRQKKNRNHNSQASSAPSSSSSTGFCSMASFSHSSTRKGIRLFGSRRNPKFLSGPGPDKLRDTGALALPLGMSIAAVVAQVLKRKDTIDENIFVDHLSQICAAAVRESLINVYGDTLNCFVENFEKSFRSTLMTLYIINETAKTNGLEKEKYEMEKCSSEVASVSSSNRATNCGCDFGVRECQSDPLLQATSSHEQQSTHEEQEENMTIDPRNNELIVHDRQIMQQMAFISPNRSSTEYNRQSILSTLDKSVIEQARSNDLKTFEMGLTMRKLQLKERELALSSDANFIERSKLSFGFSKASFKVEKFKTELEDKRHAELLRKCIDCLVAGLFVMLGCVGYGVFVYSHKRIAEATASCSPREESKSWWIPKPMAYFNSVIQILKCQFQVVSRMSAGGFMVLAIAYLLHQRSTTSNQAMPVTFMVLLLALACGFAGKLCIDTLGGSGNHWLFYWEVLCVLHLLSNLWTSMLFVILHGPINVSERTKNNPRFPYWSRRCLFYGTTSLILPLLCGFLPFASLGEWKDHFSSLLMDHLLMSED